LVFAAVLRGLGAVQKVEQRGSEGDGFACRDMPCALGLVRAAGVFVG
jgi:hypothetical protein